MNSIKSVIKGISPDLFHLLASIRFFLTCKRRLGPCQNLVAAKVFDGKPIRVLGGPFDGMAYYNKTIWGTITSKWLGCYEEEVQPVIDEIIRMNYPTIVDVGAAEGYYAVGLALKMPKARVISFDVDPIARYRQRQLAALNSVKNLEIRKFCSHADLTALADDRPAVICDIEGFEHELMDPVACPALKQLDILVETHHFGAIDPEAMAVELEQRFQATHEIQRFTNHSRNREQMVARVPKLGLLTSEQVNFALDEGRYCKQVWLWMKARNNG